LEAINAGRPVRGFARGGSVGGESGTPVQVRGGNHVEHLAVYANTWEEIARKASDEMRLSALGGDLP
jgi:hypothetical protein